MLLLTLLTLAGAAQTDTSFAVSPGTRLRLETMNGDITVQAWDRNQVRVRVAHSRRDEVRVRQSGAVLVIETTGSFGLPNNADYDLTVPAWMALTLGGMQGDVKIDGVRGALEITTLNGDITVNGGGESIKLASTAGAIRLSGARGRIDINGTSDDVIVSDVQGELAVVSISGDVILRNIDSRSVKVENLSGEVLYDGVIYDGGRYSISSHSGDLYFGIRENVNASIMVSFFSGGVRAGFPLPAPESSSRRRQTFRLGNGSAIVELDAFSGTVHLVRPGELAARFARILRRDHE